MKKNSFNRFAAVVRVMGKIEGCSVNTDDECTFFSTRNGATIKLQEDEYGKCAIVAAPDEASFALMKEFRVRWGLDKKASPHRWNVVEMQGEEDVEEEGEMYDADCDDDDEDDEDIELSDCKKKFKSLRK